MQRFALKSLEKWRSDAEHMPLVLRGARQVGKSYLVQELGKQFEHFVEINFEEQPSAQTIFSGDLTASVLLIKLQAVSQHSIIPGKTLLFLDEIQA